MNPAFEGLDLLYPQLHHIFTRIRDYFTNKDSHMDLLGRAPLTGFKKSTRWHKFG